MMIKKSLIFALALGVSASSAAFDDDDMFGTTEKPSGAEVKEIDPNVDKMLSGVSPGALSTDVDHNKDIIQLRLANQSLSTFEGLNGYLNGLAERLVTGAGLPYQGISVVVTPEKNFNAYTLENGTVFVSIGALLSLQSEDEVAGLLAHEISHVLLNHHKKNALETITNKVFDVGELYVRTQGGDNMLNDYMKVQAANWLAGYALYPAWNRTQEGNADLLAVDLLASSSLSADAMFKVLNAIKNTAAEKKQEFEKREYTKKESTSNGTSIKIDLAGFLMDHLKSIQESLSREYDEVDERKKDLADYLQKHYAERTRKKADAESYQAVLKGSAQVIAAIKDVHKAEEYMTQKESMPKARDLLVSSLKSFNDNDPNIRMKLFYINASMKKSREASDDLMKVIESEKGPFVAYQFVSEMAYRGKDYDGALSMLEIINEVFDNPTSIYPDLIKTYKAKGSSFKATGVKLKCLGTANVDLIKRCNASS